MTREEIPSMTLAPESFYTNPECLLIFYNLDEAGGEAALQRQRDALAGHTSVEELAENRVVLVVYPGWVESAR
jgi:hypothetical protein